jgi:uracil phosphoribosyltransferase
MAEALARFIFMREGLIAEYYSAGVSAYGSQPASRHAVETMKAEELNISGHRSRQINRAMMHKATLVLAMTRRHQETLETMFPDEKEKIYTLTGYAGLADEVADPFGGSYDDYLKCAGQIKNLLEICVNKIRSKPMGKLHVTEHPLVQSKITMLRDVETGNKEFRELVDEIATLICYEATRDLLLNEMEVETPLCRTKGKTCSQKFGIVPILRAGLGMVEGILHLLPTAKVGHIGLYRDPESLQPVEYYCKLPPDAHEREIFLLDPMLATGNTVSKAVDVLKKSGVSRIRFLCLLAVQTGVDKLHKDHPEIDIFTGAYDEYLNGHGYIVPGLGDAGDRLFGTK